MILFTQNRFHYLSDDKYIAHTWNNLNRDEMLYGNLFSTLINYVANLYWAGNLSQYKNDSYELYVRLEESSKC